MLGKGLESLIPQKGNGDGDGSDGRADARGDSHDDSARPPDAQAASESAAHAEPDVHPDQEARPEPPAAESQQSPEPQQSPPAHSEKRHEAPTITGSVFQIEADRIVPNPNQPRRHFDEAALRDLAHSIREFGFLQPLVVSRKKMETATGVNVEYELIAGERRLLAAKMLGLKSVPAIVRNVDLERERLELAVIENIQRENLNPIETARAFARLQDEFRMTQREIAAKLGKSREVVANAMRLLDLPEYIRTAVEKGEMSESHARFLLAVDDPNAQKRLFDDIIQNKLTTRDVRDRVGAVTGNAHRRGRPPKSEQHLPAELRAMQDSLSMDLGAPVEIQKGAAKGSITITFYSEEELRNIIQKLGKENL